MKLKKVVSLLLVAMIALGLLAACGSEEGSGSSVSQSQSQSQSQSASDSFASGFDEDPAEIVVAWWHLNVVPSDMDMVSEALSEYTLEKINVKVTLNIMDAGTYLTQAPLMVSTGEKLDLMCTFPAAAGHFNSMKAQGQLTPLNDYLEEYGQEMVAALPNESFLNATTYKGDILAMPVLANKASNLYWYARKAEFDELGIDISTIQTVEDLEEMLYAAKEQFPTKTILGGNAKTLNLLYSGMDPIHQLYYDVLGAANDYCVAVEYDAAGNTDYKVINYWETEEFAEGEALIRKWYDDGLVDKDLATKDQADDPLADPNVFSAFTAGNYTRVDQLAAAQKTEFVSVKLQDGYIDTGRLVQMTWAVPVSATEPEAAVKFMNLMYTDEYVVNMMNYGIEGTHYVKNADGTLSFPEGQEQASVGYYTGSQQFTGNSFLSYVMEGNDPNANEILRKDMETAIYSPIMGFSFDRAPVSGAFDVLSSMIQDEYKPALTSGSGSTDMLETFIGKMKSAGIDDVIAEAQSQLDAWMAENK